MTSLELLLLALHLKVLQGQRLDRKRQGHQAQAAKLESVKSDRLLSSPLSPLNLCLGQPLKPHPVTCALEDQSLTTGIKLQANSSESSSNLRQDLPS